MILLENMKDGYLYSNILLKLYLRSLKDNGRLMLNSRIPYNSQMIASVTRHQVGTVEKALEIFEGLGLVEILDNGAIYMLDIQNFIGESSTEADRKRQYRAQIAQEKDKCPDKSPDISPPEIRDKRLENKDRDRNNKYSVHFESFWSIYPRKKEKAKAYKAYNARLNDGFSEDELLTAATAYAKECTDRKTEEKYIKHGATFLGPNTPFTDYLKSERQQEIKPVEKPSYYKHLGNRTPRPDDPFQ